jgi:hypothetical protein
MIYFCLFLKYNFNITFYLNFTVANVWKVFSQTPLTNSELSKMFTDVKETHVSDWLAYPHYSVPENQSRNRFDYNYFIGKVFFSQNARFTNSII